VPQIFCQTRRFSAGGLSPGKGKRRCMAENMWCKRCAHNFGISSKFLDGEVGDGTGKERQEAHLLNQGLQFHGIVDLGLRHNQEPPLQRCFPQYSIPHL